MKALFLAAIGLILVYGWVINIVALVHAPAIALWGVLEVIRVIGIFAPLFDPRPLRLNAKTQGQVNDFGFSNH